MSDARYQPGRWVKLRLYLITLSMIGLFGGLCYRAYVLQVRETDHLRAMAEEQYLRDVELPPRRGRILDRNGAELAASAAIDSVCANPRLVGERAGEVARALAGPLHLERRDIERRLRSRSYFSWIKRRVDLEEARAVRALELPGVYLAPESQRYYPNRQLAGPLLGWAGLDGVGQEGIELAFDKYLRGARAQVPGLRDALGRAVLVSGLGDITPQAGSDVVTTLDRYLQLRLERALERGVATHHAKAGAAVVLDPKTGEIVAMASVPSVNPNKPDDARERGVRNRAVTDPFEPGSTMKTFSITGAIEAGVVRPTDHWFCENGRYMVGPAPIHDAEPIGNVTTVEVLARSSNICTSKIAAREGRERLHSMFLRFGFGQRTGVDLPGERSGQVRAAARMGPVETATMSFGQGLTATPLQLAAAYATIASGGTWYRPHVLRHVVDAEGHVTVPPAIEGRRVISPEVAATMRGMLFAVTQKGGTAQKLSVPGYTFAGKTGTAQKVDPLTRRYSTEKWASSFVGYAPAEDPRLVLFVLIDEPQGSHHGSMVAGPVFTEVMADALRWLGIAPTMAIAAEQHGKATSSAKAGPAVAQTEPPLLDDQTDAEDGEEDGFVAEDDEPRGGQSELERSQVPDFTGMSVGEALAAARRAGLRVELSGSGRATAQSPGPGAVRRGAACRVAFTPPG